MSAPIDAKSRMGQAGEPSLVTQLLAELETYSGGRFAKTPEPRPASGTKLAGLDAKIRPADLKVKKRSLRSRVARGLARVLIIFGMGVASTLAWQSHGDTLRAMIASSYPRLGWLAPQSAAHVEIPADRVATTPAPAPATPPAAATPSPDYSEQLKTGLAAVRESVNQVVATQQWMASDIAKLQAGQQDILDKLSATPRLQDIIDKLNSQPGPQDIPDKLSATPGPQDIPDKLSSTPPLPSPRPAAAPAGKPSTTTGLGR